MKMVKAMNGQDPFNDGPKPRGPAARHVPPPDKLRPLTPELFDAMFPGKQGAKKQVVRRRR